jgi:hypothetical protein
MYTSRDYPTKKALRTALEAGERVTVYQPGPFGENVPESGTVYLEGPHYPRPHSWYGTGTLKDGVLVKVK